MTNHLNYQGKAGELVFLMIQNLILTIITFGLYVPFAKTNMRQYIWGYTFFNQHPLVFLGTGKELFIIYLFTCFIYGIFIYISNHLLPLLLAGIITQLILGLITSLAYLFLFLRSGYGSFRYSMNRTAYRGIRFKTTKTDNYQLNITILKYSFLSLITFGLYMPMALYHLDHLKWNNSQWGNIHFKYKVNKDDYWRIYIKAFFLIPLTFGLYLPFMHFNLHQLQVKSLKIDQLTFNIGDHGWSFFGLSLRNYILIIISFGLAYPWTITSNLHFILKHLEVNGEIDYSQIKNTKVESDDNQEMATDTLDSLIGDNILTDSFFDIW